MNLEGQRLGEFEILEQLGQGGMGAVYKARQVSLDRLVALKTLQGALASDPEYIARFRREAKKAAALNHPNLVQVYAAGENDGLHWFAMEYVEGESAQTRLKRKGRLDPTEAIAIATHVCTALDYAWRKAQLIHRDIKPDNIFLSNDGEVKLGDLGLAKSAGETQSLTTAGSSMGTPHYVSPEQAEAKKDVDLRADIYSLGCTLFHLVSGQAPYTGDAALTVMMKHVTAPVPNLHGVWPECPEELARVVMKMMLKPPDARQQSYEEVIADLRRAYDGLTGASMPSMLAVTQQPAARKRAKQQSPLARKPAVAKKRAPTAASVIVVIALLTALAALLHFAPWKKGDTGGTRSVVSPSSLDETGKVGADGAAARPSSVLPDSPPPPRPSSAPMSGATEPGFLPMFDANGIRDWKHNGSGGKWDFAGGVLSGRITTKSTTRLRCPQSLVPADFEVRFAVRGDRGPAFEFRGKAGEMADSYVFDPTNLRTGGSVFWDVKRNGKLAKVGQRIRITRDDQREELSELTALPQWKDGEWNEVILTVQGNHFSGTCNGVLVAEVTDESTSYRAGPGEFGFRLSNGPDGELSAEFKDIRIKRLPVASPANHEGPAAVTIATGQWVDLMHDAKATLANGAMLVPTGLEMPPGSSVSVSQPEQRADLAIRMKTTLDPQVQTMSLRCRATSVAGYWLTLKYPEGVLLERQSGGRFAILASFPIPAALHSGIDYELELRIVGSHLTALLDGIIVGEADDGTLQASGIIGALYGSSGGKAVKKVFLKSLQYLPLGGSAVPNAAKPATAPAAAPLSPSAEPWQDVLRDPAKLVLTGAANRTPEGLRFTDAGVAMGAPGQSPKGDGAVRMTATFGGLRPQLLARDTAGGGMYQLSALDAKTITFNRWDNAGRKSITLRHFPLRESLQPGQDYQLELRAVGQTFTAKLNGEILGTVTDGTFSQGPFGVGVAVHDAAPVLVKALEVLDLDAPGGASSAPAFREFPSQCVWALRHGRQRVAMVRGLV